MFKPAPLFGAHCILPMGRELRVFGEADDGAQVRVSLRDAGGTELTCGRTAAADGRFLCILPAVDDAQTGCTLNMTCGNESFAAKDVAVGLLFLAGGQSNMELALWNADEGQTLIRSHEDTELRYFNVPKCAIRDEAAIAQEEVSHWETIRPDVGGDMSAVAYFFACRLRSLLKLPVGIIDCYWGGTSITCWMDEEALARTAEGTRYVSDWETASGGKTMEQFRAEWDAFQAEMDEWNDKCAKLREQEPGIAFERIIELAGYCPWHPPIGPGSPYRPAGMYHTMLERVAPAALTAILYYQGEEDAGKTTVYDQLLIQLVLRWRELFRAMDVPFVNMQLPMWIDRGVTDDGTWARTRMAQEKAHRMIGSSALCCIIDCGELDNIHPTDKRTPGERLADEWLALCCDAEAEARLSPAVIARRPLPGRLLLTTDKPIRLVNGEADLFEAAGQDGSFVPAKARLLDARTIELTADGVAMPVYARYAYVAFAKVHVFGENGAPLRPFCLM